MACTVQPLDNFVNSEIENWEESYIEHMMNVQYGLVEKWWVKHELYDHGVYTKGQLRDLFRHMMSTLNTPFSYLESWFCARFFFTREAREVEA